MAVLRIKQEDGTWIEVPAIAGGGITEDRVNELIDAKLGVIENGTY
jgi:hypothetical protein